MSSVGRVASDMECICPKRGHLERGAASCGNAVAVGGTQQGMRIYRGRS
jgi:hypothetical protein